MARHDHMRSYKMCAKKMHKKENIIYVFYGNKNNQSENHQRKNIVYANFVASRFMADFFNFIAIITGLREIRTHTQSEQSKLTNYIFPLRYTVCVYREFIPSIYPPPPNTYKTSCFMYVCAHTTLTHRQ